jgi:hypothetical protein
MRTLRAMLALAAISLVTLAAAMANRLSSSAPSNSTPQTILSSRAQEEIRQVETHIDRAEQEALAGIPAARIGHKRLPCSESSSCLHKELSVNRNETCALLNRVRTDPGYETVVMFSALTGGPKPVSGMWQHSNHRRRSIPSPQFTPDEKAGYTLFRGSATHYNECHRDGGPGEGPLFTDFTASNLGLPRNSAIPFYHEDRPDKYGYTANVDGPN